MPTLVQYVIVNADIVRKLSWPIAYFNDMDRMHKVVLEAGSEDDLRKLSDNLTTNDIKHKLWIESPENIAACIALKPYDKEDVRKYMRKLKLLNVPLIACEASKPDESMGPYGTATSWARENARISRLLQTLRSITKKII